MGEAIHFKGRDAIVKAYESNNVPAFALVCGKDLLYQYTGDDLDEGAAELGGMIDMLNEGHSAAVYQVRMYRKPPEDLTLKDKFNYSFKCRLSDETAPDFLNENSVLAKRIRALEDQRAAEAVEDEEDEEPDDRGWQATLGAILSKPEVQNYLLPRIFGLMDKVFGAATRGAATVSGVPEEARSEAQGASSQSDQVVDSSQLYHNLSPEQRAALDQAMGILLQFDPEIGTNLLKCATLLKTNPTKYKFAVSML